jgi:hypothetical protein
MGDFLNEPVILLNDVIQIFDLEYFNKADQTGQHQQEINVFQSGLEHLFFYDMKNDPLIGRPCARDFHKCVPPPCAGAPSAWQRPT